MRLIEFLQPKSISPGNGEIRLYRLPMWVLEGSTRDYNNYRSHRLFESLTINEAAIDRYKSQITVFAEIDQLSIGVGLRLNYFGRAMDYLNWAVQVLKRDDRIVYFMRFVKIKFLNELSGTPISSGPNHAAFVDKNNTEYQKSMRKMEQLFGSSQEVMEYARYIVDRYSETQFEHFLSMNIPSIMQTVWDTQTPKELIAEFRKEETAYMERQSQVIDMQDDLDGASIIMKFPNGSAWFNLNRTSCSVEGKAMGHCGNTAANRSTETVLSFREPVDEGGRARNPNRPGTHWRPRMTFILNTQTGMLGEMKGRANKKPTDELHPYILALLRNSLIKGIVGGGYAAEQNFSLDDLDPDVKAALIQEKPGLGTLQDQYKLEGFSDDVIGRIESTLDGYDISHEGIDPVSKELIILKYNNPLDFINNWCPSRSTAHNIAGYVLGGDNLDGDYYSGDLDNRQDLARDAFRKDLDMWHHLQAYVRQEYAQQLGLSDDDQDQDDSDYDIDDIDDVIRLLKDEDDDLYDQIGYAISTGHEVGAQDEMTKAFWKWIVSPFDDSDDVRVVLSDQKYDGPVELRMALTSIIQMDKDNDLESLGYNGWHESLSIDDIDEPHYGWDGYDDDAAMEYMSDQFEIPEVESFEIKQAGTSTKADAIKFQTAATEAAGGAELKDKKTGPGGLLIFSDETRWTPFIIINGIITTNIWIVRGTADEQTANWSRQLRILAGISDEQHQPIVIRSYNNDRQGDYAVAGEAGFKKIEHQYLRHDPKITESDDQSVRIKLRGFDQHDGDVDGFMDELNQITDPHPFNRNSVLYGSISLDVSPWGGQIHLGDIASLGDKGAGHGTEALQMLITLAKRHNVKISGIAKAYSKLPGHIQSTTRLVKWYKKNGFRITGGYAEDGFDIEFDPGRAK